MSDRFDLAALEAATRGHTPGPWDATESDIAPEQARVWGPDGDEVAAVFGNLALEGSAIATARLIAAAPRLLAECRRLTDENAQLRRHLDKRAAGTDPLTEQLRGERDRLTARITELEAAQAWVPVTERLPSGSCDLLMAHQSGIVRAGWWDGREGALHFEDDEGWHNPTTKGGTVTHWRPLPAPPTGGPT